MSNALYQIMRTEVANERKNTFCKWNLNNLAAFLLVFGLIAEPVR
jgi:hypothetical protein